MSVNVRWDNRDKTTILLEFESEWSFPDLESAIQVVDDYIISVVHPVDVLIDVEGAKIPKDVLGMAKRLVATGDPRPNEGRRLVAGASGVIRQGYQLIQKTFARQLNGREILFADDLDAGRAILRSLRQP